LGPKRVRELYKTLHIQSSPDLKKYLKDHVGDTPPRFVKKTMETLAENLGLQKANAHRITYAQALARADEIISVLKKTKLFDQVEAVGSLRRKESTIGDIDILIVSNRDDALQQALGALPSIRKILSNGPQKASVLLETGPQADFRVFDQQTLGSARIYFTGNKAHNIQLRKIAIRKGFKLNEYGLFDAKGQKLAGAAEKDIYGKLGFKWVPPEKRKGTREFEDYRL
jgi:DNA polymerase (family X)